MALGKRTKGKGGFGESEKASEFALAEWSDGAPSWHHSASSPKNHHHVCVRAGVWVRGGGHSLALSRELLFLAPKEGPPQKSLSSPHQARGASARIALEWQDGPATRARQMHANNAPISHSIVETG